MKVQVKFTITNMSILTFNSTISELLTFNNNIFIKEYNLNLLSLYYSDSEAIKICQKKYSDDIHNYYLLIRNQCYEELGEYPDIDIDYKVIHWEDMKNEYASEKETF